MRKRRRREPVQNSSFNIPIPVKPSTYKLQETWVERLGGFVVYYSKEKDEVELEVSDRLLKALGVHVNLMAY